MPEREILAWFTTKNGVHIPVYAGQSKDAAIQEHFKNIQIQKSKQQAEQANTTELSQALRLPNISADKANKSSDILKLGTDKRFIFKPGTKIKQVYVFAGAGTSKEFRRAAKYAKRYGGKPSQWQHCTGKAFITDGINTYLREIHWVQLQNGPIKEAFIKEK